MYIWHLTTRNKTIHRSTSKRWLTLSYPISFDANSFWLFIRAICGLVQCASCQRRDRRRNINSRSVHVSHRNTDLVFEVDRSFVVVVVVVNDVVQRSFAEPVKTAAVRQLRQWPFTVQPSRKHPHRRVISPYDTAATVRSKTDGPPADIWLFYSP